jgi:hypothetical protein
MAISSLRTFLIATVGVFLLYCFSYWFVHAAISPAQEALLPGSVAFVSLAFLPSGVRIVSFMLFGWRAVPPILVGSLLCNHFFWAVQDVTLLLLLSTWSTLVFYLALQTSKLLGQSIFLADTLPRLPPFRTIILVTVVASALNGIISSAIFGSFDAYLNGGLLAIGYVLGDMLGTLCFMVILKSLFTFMNKQQIRI